MVILDKENKVILADICILWYQQRLTEALGKSYIGPIHSGGPGFLQFSHYMYLCYYYSNNYNHIYKW